MSGHSEGMMRLGYNLVIRNSAFNAMCETVFIDGQRAKPRALDFMRIISLLIAVKLP